VGYYSAYNSNTQLSLTDHSKQFTFSRGGTYSIISLKLFSLILFKPNVSTVPNIRYLLSISTHRLIYYREEQPVPRWYSLANEVSHSPVHGNVESIQKALAGTEYRAHHLVVYPDLATLRDVYSYYISTALNGKNEVVIMLPFYETTGSVRRILGHSKVDVLKHEKQHSLIIMDSLKGYFGSDGVRSLIDQTIDYAKKTGKKGVSAFGDMGSFFHQHKENNNLIEHELSLPSEHADGMNLKSFCLYHKQEFDKRLSIEQRDRLLEHHGKNMIITSS
jgi:hypothetical protein